MAYVESFARAMERAHASVSYWDRKTLDHLQAAHDAEMRQCSKSEYHRGFEDGQATRDAEQWQLDRERAKIIEAVRKVVPEGYFGSDEMLSEICRAIYSPVFGWTAEAGRYLCDRLICLLGGKSINKGAETNAKVVKNGEKYQLATYDVLGNERHKAVCELRKLRERDAKIWNIEISIALGLDLDASNDDVCDRLIYLLGGDTILREDGDGMARGDFERGTVPCDSVGARDVPEETVVDECNFSTPESDMDAKDAGQNPAETQEESSDHVAQGTGSAEDPETPESVENRQKPTEKGTIDAPVASITGELRKFAEAFRYEWHDEKDGSVCYTTSDMPPSLDSINVADYINAIADRIDERHDELQAEADRQMRLASMNAKALLRKVTECNELHKSLVKVAEHVGVPHERDLSEYDDSTIANATIFCVDALHRGMAEMDTRLNSLFDLIRDAAEDYQECQRLLRVFKCHAKDMRKERDDLQDKLQAISVLCEQDDG